MVAPGVKESPRDGEKLCMVLFDGELEAPEWPMDEDMPPPFVGVVESA